MTISEIGQRIKVARLEREMTLQEVAGNIGLTKSTIQRYESGTIKKILLPVIEAIAQTLRVNPSWLIGKSEEKELVCLSKIEFTKHEQAHITKYRTLDERGQINIDNVLEAEYQYVLNHRQKESASDIKQTSKKVSEIM